MPAELITDYRNVRMYNCTRRFFLGTNVRISPYFNTLLLNSYLASDRINSVKIIDAFWENICERATESNLEKEVDGLARN